MNNIESIFLLKPPYFHLLIGKSLDIFNIESKMHLSKDIFVQVIEGSKCDTVSNLFKEFANAFNFPSYFGDNWSAFDECMNDLEWLNSNGYILFITQADKLLEKDEDFRTFINVLNNTIQEWVEGRSYDSFPTGKTLFHVVFQSAHNEIKDRFERIGLESSKINILTIK